MQDHSRPAGSDGLSDDISITDILESATFQKSPALRALLKYLWEHRHADLNEFQIAVDALGRKPDFNPKTDSTVRVQMLRMRQKLKEFYEKEGAGARVRIHLPTGTHRLALEEIPAEDPPLPETVPPPSSPSRLPWILTACFALIAAAALLYGPARTRMTDPVPALPALWRGFTANGKPVRIILPNLTFFRWLNNTVKVRDTRINDFEELSDSPELRTLIERWGKPELMAHSYISAPDAYAASELAAFLARSGIAVSVAGHREAALDKEDEFNRVLIGNVQSGEYILPLIADASFEPLAGFSFRNRHPKPGEPDVFPLVIESRRREIVPGAIYRRNQTLVLLSENTTSLVRLLTGTAKLPELENRDRFDLLAVAEIEGGRVVRVQPKAIRPLP